MKQQSVQPYMRNTILLLVMITWVVTASFSKVRYATQHLSEKVISTGGSHIQSLLVKYGLVNVQEKNLAEGLDQLEQCVRVYSETQKFSLDVEYSVFYNSENFEKPADKKNGKIIRSKDNFYQEEMGNLKIMNKEHELILNERAELITVRNRVHDQIEPVIFETDSLVQFISRVEKTEDGYLYFLEEGPVEKFEVITYSDGSLKIWRSYYRSKMDFGEGEVKVITQLRYNNFTKNPKTDPAVFSLEPYVSISKKGEIKTKENYKNYYVLNQLRKL